MNPKLRALLDLANPVGALATQGDGERRPAPSSQSLRKRRDGRYDVLETLPGDGGSASQQYDVDAGEAERLWRGGARRLTDSQWAESGGQDAESMARQAADAGNERVLVLANGEPTEMSRLSAARGGFTPMKVSPDEYSRMRAEADSPFASQVAADVAAGDKAGAARMFGQSPAPPVPAPAAGRVPGSQKRSGAPSISVSEAGQAPAPRPFQPLQAPASAVAAVQAPPSNSPATPDGSPDPDLDAALAEVRQRRLGAAIGRAGAMAGAAFSGADTSRQYDALEADADRPLAEYGARKDSALRKQAEAKAAARNDPNSPESKRLQLAVSKAMPGVYSPEELSHLTAADEPSVMKFGEMSTSLRQRQEEARARAAEQQAGRDFDAQQADKQRAFTAGENAKNRAVDRARIAAAGERGGGLGGAGARVPAGEATSLGEADSAIRALDALEKQRQDKTGTFSGVTQYLPGTDARQYAEDDTKSAAQVIGRFLEGGKLTDADVPRYQAMMPTAGDSPERAANKIANLKRLIADRRDAQVAGLGAAGYRTAGFDRPASPAMAQKVRISNGTETYDVDPADVAEAQREGFRVLQ